MSTTDKDEGGSAFPVSGFYIPHLETWQEGMPGMTLRDYAAINALNGLLSSEIAMQSFEKFEIDHPGVDTKDIQAKVLATLSYQLADAMMEARKK